MDGNHVSQSLYTVMTDSLNRLSLKGRIKFVLKVVKVGNCIFNNSIVADQIKHSIS